MTLKGRGNKNSASIRDRPVEKLRYIAFSHLEADECGSLNEWFITAPHSVPLCGTVAAMVSVGDLFSQRCADLPPITESARSPDADLGRMELESWCIASSSIPALLNLSFIQALISYFFLT